MALRRSRLRGRPPGFDGGSLPVAQLLSAALTAGVLALLQARNHRYFFIDDRMSETVPKLLDMGRLVRAGEAPWLTTSFFNGSGHAQVSHLPGKQPSTPADPAITGVSPSLTCHDGSGRADGGSVTPAVTRASRCGRIRS